MEKANNTQDIQLLANAIRGIAADGVQKANSGHPGMPMGAADYAALLWSDYLHFDPTDTQWSNRDRFVLSAGHGCMLLYTLLHLFGFDLPMKELQSFRQWGSITPGHPEFGVTPGVETTTGPLGAGFSNGVGLAASGKMFASRYSTELFNHRVYGIVSDGDLMEGVASEAASLAGHLGLNNLIYLYDDNHISIGGDTKVSFTENVPKRFEAYDWFVQSVDGHDIEAIRSCLEKAHAETKRPSIICCRTKIGYGSPNRAGDHEIHGAPLGADEVKATKAHLGLPPDQDFYIPAQVATFLKQRIEQKQKEHAAWKNKFREWEGKNPEKAKQYHAQIKREVPGNLKQELINAFSEPKKDATRNLSGKAIQVIANHVPYFVGGSADLEPSNKTLIKEGGEIQKNSFGDKNFRFGVREHGMGGFVNGLAYTQSWFPYSATFLVFSDYMRPTLRLAAISHLQTLFIFTHDSFYVGEDGPTHEPIEHIASLRLINNLYVYRPADGMEVAMCYYSALERKNGPCVLLFTRQNLTPVTRPAGFSPDEMLKGAYAANEEKDPDIVIVATGSEVSLAVEAAEIVKAKGHKIRVVSMPCVELFLKQDQAWREKLIPQKAKRVSIEAGSTRGWSDIIGPGLHIGIDHYGASAPAEVLAEKFGFTPTSVSDRILKWL